ncbi:AhpC/TSA family protein [Ancylomarina euxinus]|uniref:AhpC/TSA family protein n=1 Tax=Ancylomarina euxinus TaxID=2283627 RepID=A0A425XZS3_9BACT|nr:TlpA disulfide reductase family protein [Ancylomarina euxinus]MCZ4695397.1 TlpA disulfide reductase family protein [Ancylomarina euxinus]MUP15593.1 redoxin domain-containing protein [Ancylomarina euxinus]RRG20966.1 AhpC/TSA family protein [Ancylomarina euxinus]
MKNLLVAFLALILFSCEAPVKDTITITGHVKFPDNNFKMTIVKRNGFDKTVIDSVDVKKDGSYAFEMKVDKPGVYTLDCQKWQSVQFWAEDEDLKIDFRGQDTAKMKIKNPPYVYINGGKNNEVMNLVAFNYYRNYQSMIAAGRIMYEASLSDSEKWKEVAGKGYNACYDDLDARTHYIAEHYADRNSIISLLSSLRKESDKPLVEKIIKTLEAKNPNYQPLIDYKNARDEAIAQEERLAIGKEAPIFEFPTADGKMISLKDFRGQYLIVDFWASWCGPCRNEIPHLKEVYETYKDKGVEILSVSIDKSKNAWKKAMSQENMTWPQIQAPGAGKDIMKEYQFSGIPYIILLDKEGKIVGKQLRGKSLTEKLESIFK